MNELYTEIQNAANIIAAPNWADKLSAMAASIAVIVAVIVALRQNKILKQQNEIAIKQAEIAEEQNKIALFDRRYELDKCISFCNHFAFLITIMAKQNEDLYRIFVFASNKEEIDYDDNMRDVLNTEMRTFIGQLDKTMFLFSHDIADYSSELNYELNMVITNCLVLKKDYLAEAKHNLNELLEKYISNDICNKIAKEMCLK